MKVSAHLHDNYRDYYKEGDSEWRRLGAADKARHIVALCKGLSINSIVEIGAGEGSILKRLSELGFGKELYALEISSSAVEAIENKRIDGLKECLIFDGYHVPYGDKKFDLAVFSHVIEHVEYPRKLLREGRRIAKYVFVEVPLEDTMRLSRDFVFNKVGHINFYSSRTIRRLVQTCGLRVLDQRIDHPSRAVYTFRRGKKGLVNYYVKGCLLKCCPFLASSLFTYYSSLICEDAGEGS